MVELRVEAHVHPFFRCFSDGFEEFDQESAGRENRVISNTVKSFVPPWVSRKIGHTIAIVGTRWSSI